MVDPGMITPASPKHSSGRSRSNVELNTQSVNSATGRAQAVFIRDNNEVGAMSQEQRMKVKAQNMIRKVLRRSSYTGAGGGEDMYGVDSSSVGELSRRSYHSGRSNTGRGGGGFSLGFGIGSGSGHGIGVSASADDDDDDNGNADGSEIDFGDCIQPTPPPPPTPLPNPQYRLAATTVNNQRSNGNCMSRFFSCLCGSKGDSTGIGIHHNRRLASSLHWMFRVNFLFLFGVMCAIFFMWVMIFAGFIVAAGKMDPKCVRVGGEPFDLATSQFADAFALSWTTFSTVGYGSTYPALGHENDNPTNCLFITFICSLESFLGVLYSGFCGAILFGKVLRIQSHAQVIFSDPIVIRYGNGVQQVVDHENDIDDEETASKRIPCPVLEFRVINKLFGETGGEIMDAQLNVVANVDADDADPGLRNALDRDRGRTAGHRHHRGHSHTPSLGGNSVVSFLRNRADSRATAESRSGSHGDTANAASNNNAGSLTMDSTSDSHSDSGRTSDDSKATGVTRSTFFFDSLLRRQHQAVDEDPSSRLVNKRIFSKMMIEAGEHPFFKRVWLGRHVLDESSPILKPKVRRQIRRNGGYWPERLNNYEAVRESLQFNQILVSLNGVSNVSAADVYAQKIYDFVDINVGYQFVNVLYKDESNGILKVDTDLINDVREQNGGGGEPLILGE